MKTYETVIGLEVHVQLATESKVFCGCSTKFAQPPNASTCPVCLGLPGALPVLNKRAFLFAVKTALGLGCRIEGIIKFDRKNYYYPDLPKNYQISQYDLPLGHDGACEIFVNGRKKKIRIKRVHLEEDAGKLIHPASGNSSFVDFNRSGCALLEIVSEADLATPEEAYEYLTALKSILRYLDVSDCNMEEGSLRCDANISVRVKGAPGLGVKAEIKNMNSFKAVRDALRYEEGRHRGALELGEKIVQETRLWDAEQGLTRSMRSKEQAEDYRYFPEPDLVPFSVKKEEIERIKSGLPELPQAKKERLAREYKLAEYDSGLLVRDSGIAEFFERAAQASSRPKQVANWILGDVSAFLNSEGVSIKETALKAEHLAELVRLVDSGKISGKIAKGILPKIIKKGIPPSEIVKKENLSQIQDEGQLERIVEKVIAGNEKSVKDYRAGKEQALMFLVGQAMKATKGKANPQKVSALIKEKLKG